MKVFVILTALIAVTLADQSHHQSFKQGNAPAVTTSIHKPHHGAHAIVASQPSAQPSEVNQYHNEEKYAASAHAPVPKYANKPSHHGHGPYHPAPAYHGPSYKPAPYHAPAYHTPAYKPAPYHAPAYKPASYQAPAYKAPAYKAPVHHVPAYVAPVHHAPAYKAPVHHVPAYKAPVHHAPAYKAPAYHEPAYDTPAVYTYGYAVADDYSGANFAANEDRNDYATTGNYRVALPDGRTQIVTYRVDDAYSGYVADVQYEGHAQYPEYKPVHAPHHGPGPYKAPLHA